MVDPVLEADGLKDEAIHESALRHPTLNCVQGPKKNLTKELSDEHKICSLITFSKSHVEPFKVVVERGRVAQEFTDKLII